MAGDAWRRCQGHAGAGCKAAAAAYSPSPDWYCSLCDLTCMPAGGAGGWRYLWAPS